jgi:uncharacterized protein YceK
LGRPIAISNKSFIVLDKKNNMIIALRAFIIAIMSFNLFGCSSILNRSTSRGPLANNISELYPGVVWDYRFIIERQSFFNKNFLTVSICVFDFPFSLIFDSGALPFDLLHSLVGISRSDDIGIHESRTDTHKDKAIHDD